MKRLKTIISQKILKTIIIFKKIMWSDLFHKKFSILIMNKYEKLTKIINPYFRFFSRDML